MGPLPREHPRLLSPTMPSSLALAHDWSSPQAESGVKQGVEVLKHMGQGKTGRGMKRENRRDEVYTGDHVHSSAFHKQGKRG